MKLNNNKKKVEWVSTGLPMWCTCLEISLHAAMAIPSHILAHTWRNIKVDISRQCHENRSVQFFIFSVIEYVWKRSIFSSSPQYTPWLQCISAGKKTVTSSQLRKRTYWHFKDIIDTFYFLLSYFLIPLSACNSF